MSVQDTVLIVQTVILLATGAVVAWYTLETSRIRRATSEQARLLAEQLAMLRAQSERDEARRASSVQPVFRAGGGQQTDQQSTFTFTNVGTAPIRDLQVGSNDYRMSVAPSAYLGPSETVTLTVPGLPRPTPRFEFHFEYTDALGIRRRRAFVHTGESRFEDREVVI